MAYFFLRYFYMMLGNLKHFFKVEICTNMLWSTVKSQAITITHMFMGTQVSHSLPCFLALILEHPGEALSSELLLRHTTTLISFLLFFPFSLLLPWAKQARP